METILPGPVHAAIGEAIQFVYTFIPYAEATVIVPSSLDGEVAKLAEAVGFAPPVLKYVLSFFLAYPLGLVMNILPYGKMKHAFSLILGVLLLQFAVGAMWVHQLITSVVCYIMFVVLPPSVFKMTVPTFLMTYMTLTHLHRMYINYLGFDMDYTSEQMVLTIKLYSLAYNLYDGGLLAQGKGDSNRATKKCAPFAVTKLPGILEFLGYTFCFANILAGPAFEYSVYCAACDGTLLFTPEGKPRGKVSNVWPTLRALVSSIVCLALYAVGVGYFPILDPVDPQNNVPAILTPEFLAKPWVYRYGYQWVALVFTRLQYYFAWIAAEGANNIWYAGFEGFDDAGNPRGWDTSSNIDILAFETGPDIKTISAAWNKKTALWLSRYVYIRTNGSLLATYALSAFWHGFYPGYYLFFFSVPLLTTCERLTRKKITPRFGEAGKKRFSLYGIVSVLVTSLLVEYSVITFQLLSLERSLLVWRHHYFFGHILGIVYYIVLTYMVKTPPQADAVKKKQ